MTVKTKSIIIHASPENVFAYMDNISNTGMHMTKSSMPMMGSKLILQQLSENATGLNAKFRWCGKMMGFTMDFTVVVKKWTKDEEKIWETIGKAKMIILSWYQMRLILYPQGDSTKAKLSISYTKPKKNFFQFIAFFLAPLYANWCLNNMLKDSRINLEKKMIKLKPYAALFLTIGGFLQVAIGIFFIFLRAPLLPEDSRYIGTSLNEIENKIPGLSAWLQKVFWVMGCYVLTAGLLTVYIAQTSFRKRVHGAFVIVFIAGITSIGAMTVINFMLHSDFKWLLLAFTLPWFIALILYLFHK
ncbi:MAG: hypothetical protein ABIR30_00865 [Chitinophagaceae bacterium]